MKKAVDIVEGFSYNFVHNIHKFEVNQELRLFETMALILYYLFVFRIKVI